jgi:hypothetical protein
MIETLGAPTADMVRDLAASQGVCVRPIMRPVLDRETGCQAWRRLAPSETVVTACWPLPWQATLRS